MSEGPYCGSVEDLEETSTVFMGLVNLKLLRMRRVECMPDTHRKTLKLGPKTQRSSGRKPLQTFHIYEKVVKEGWGALLRRPMQHCVERKGPLLTF